MTPFLRPAHRTYDGEPFVPVGPTATYRIPKTLYDDHISRALPGGLIVSETKKHYTVELDLADYTELLGDADHYSDPVIAADLGFEYGGLIASARATKNALVKAGPPPVAPPASWDHPDADLWLQQNDLP